MQNHFYAFINTHMYTHVSEVVSIYHFKVCLPTWSVQTVCVTTESVFKLACTEVYWICLSTESTGMVVQCWCFTSDKMFGAGIKFMVALFPSQIQLIPSLFLVIYFCYLMTFVMYNFRIYRCEVPYERNPSSSSSSSSLVVVVVTLHINVLW